MASKEYIRILIFLVLFGLVLITILCVDLRQNARIQALEQSKKATGGDISPKQSDTHTQLPPKTSEPVGSVKRRFEDLLDAIEIVESGGNCNAVGDNGRAVGAYQIHLCYMQDAGNAFKPDDRYDRAKSREMVRLYMKRYATYNRLGREPTFEDIARIHNGGLYGWKRESTKPYWEKVKKVLYGSKE